MMQNVSKTKKGEGDLPNIFWITRTNEILSGDTHSVDVWNEILKKKNLEVSQEDYNNEESVIHKLNDEEFRELGFSEEDVDVLRHRMAVRQYAIEEWNWIRCRKIKGGYIAQIKNATPNTKRRLEYVFPIGTSVLVEVVKNKKETEWLV